MSLRKLATAAALASALSLSTVAAAATPVVASAQGSHENLQGGLLFGAPIFVTFMGLTFIGLLIKVTADNSTSP